MALHHVDDPEAMEVGLVERLEPGGMLVIIDWIPSRESFLKAMPVTAMNTLTAMKPILGTQVVVAQDSTRGDILYPLTASPKSEALMEKGPRRESEHSGVILRDGCAWCLVREISTD